MFSWELIVMEESANCGFVKVIFGLFIAAAYCLMGQMYGQQDNETPFTLLDDRSAKTAKIAQTRIPPKKDWIAMKSEREKKN